MFIHEWQGQTTMHPLALLVLLLLLFFLFKVERKNAVIPFLIMACFISVAQRIVIAGLDFNMIRILVLFGWMRILFRGETNAFEMKTIDWVIILWALTSTIAYTALRGSSGALIYKLGTSFDAIGMYFLFRCLIRDWEDVRRIAAALAYLSIPVALFFIFEKQTGRNLFSIFGGVPEFTVERQGKLRAQGAFPHAIIAGCFWATQIPIIATLWWCEQKKLAVVGIVCSLLIIISTASSTPLAGLGAILIGMFMYKVWSKMKPVWWGFVLLLFVLHIVMEAPVWHLISRLDFVGGSTGYHRFMLIDQAINHFWDWWLIGIISTGSWGWSMFDVANEYVNNGVRGGILTLILFITILCLSFKAVGRMIRVKESEGVNRAMPWAIGVALFVHCMVFIGISYFGQIIVIWMLLLGMIASLASQKYPVKEQ